MSANIYFSGNPPNETLAARKFVSSQSDLTRTDASRRASASFGTEKCESHENADVAIAAYVLSLTTLFIAPLMIAVFLWLIWPEMFSISITPGQ